MFVIIGKTIMGDAVFKYNGVVFALDEEEEGARQFCETINQVISSQLGTDRHPRVETFDALSYPGMQIITNLDEALSKAKYVFFNDTYYREDRFGLFAGNVAMLNSHPDRFIRLMFERSDAGASDEHLSLASFNGLHLTPEWELNEREEEKLKRLSWVGFPDEDQAEQQPQGMAGGDDNLDVMNPSISSTSDLSSLASFSEETQVKFVIGANNFNQKGARPKKKMPTVSTSRLSCTQPWVGDNDLVEDSAETPESEQSGPVCKTDSRQKEYPLLAIVKPTRQTAAQGAESENTSATTVPPAYSGRNTSNVHAAFPSPTDEAGNRSVSSTSDPSSLIQQNTGTRRPTVQPNVTSDEDDRLQWDELAEDYSSLPDGATRSSHNSENPAARQTRSGTNLTDEQREILKDFL